MPIDTVPSETAPPAPTSATEPRLSNTHKAYAVVEQAILETRSGTHFLRHFLEAEGVPRIKTIASGSEAFCREKAAEYIAVYGGSVLVYSNEDEPNAELRRWRDFETYGLPGDTWQDGPLVGREVVQ